VLDDWYAPAEHVVQDDAGEVAYAPAEHVVQDVLASFELNIPPAHAEQEACEVPAEVLL
jgi:hypothetical protein